jgi:hypothetical protein
MNLDYQQAYNDPSGDCSTTREKIGLDEFFLKTHPHTDFIKIDTDGHDEVLMSARELVVNSQVLGLGVECQFHGLVHDRDPPAASPRSGTWCHDSGRLSFRINPGQRGVERSSLPYQVRRKSAP